MVTFPSFRLFRCSIYLTIRAVDVCYPFPSKKNHLNSHQREAPSPFAISHWSDHRYSPPFLSFLLRLHSTIQQCLITLNNRQSITCFISQTIFIDSHLYLFNSPIFHSSITYHTPALWSMLSQSSRQSYLSRTITSHSRSFYRLASPYYNTSSVFILHMRVSMLVHQTSILLTSLLSVFLPSSLLTLCGSLSSS